MRLAPGSVPAGVSGPAYDRRALKSGIVHLGLGAFMRAHLAPITDAALAAHFDPAWGISGVSLRQPGTRDALAPQGGLYTLAQRDAAGQRLQIVGCVRECLVAPDDPAAVLARIASADARIVSLTVTEKGYCHDPASGALRRDHADIEHDLARPTAPRSALGFIVQGLALRRSAGLDGLTLMSLDNLPANGRTLHGLVLAMAEAREPALAAWIDAHCRFPNSMVDRIVPRTTDADRCAVAAALGADDAWPVVAEPFVDWAVEDDFAAGRPDWTAGGARFVPEAEPWERLKLRMVNGAHSTLAYLGMLAGWATVDAAMAQPALREHLAALMRDEIEPTLPALPGLDLDDYRERLLQRFANPALAHRTAQIAMDGSQKLPQRLLGTVRDRLAAGQPIDRLALGIAAWLHFLRGVNDAGQPHAIDDPLAADLATHGVRAEAAAGDVERARVWTGFTPVFGDLAGQDALVQALAPHLARLRQGGVLNALTFANGSRLA